jgi:hypothetical protein
MKKQASQLSVCHRVMAVAIAMGMVMDPRSAMAWGMGHQIISQGAYASLPAELKSRWDQTHRDSEPGVEKPIAVSLADYFCKIPDQADGPSKDGSDIENRKRAAKFLYAELDGKFFPPLAYADPDRDKKKPRPKTYHYFTYQTEELNQAFCLKGARWYFEKISTAFRAGDDLLAAEYAGAFAHAIQDRVSPYHVWDGYTAKREAFEDKMAEQGLQLPENSFRGKAAGASLFWTVGEAGMMADIGDYRPRSLGASVEEAAIEFTKRLFANREYSEQIYTDPEGFIGAHLKDDWRNKKSSQETDRHLSKIARENAKLTADVWWTAWKLATDSDQ